MSPPYHRKPRVSCQAQIWLTMCRNTARQLANSRCFNARPFEKLRMPRWEYIIKTHSGTADEELRRIPEGRREALIGIQRCTHSSQPLTDAVRSTLANWLVVSRLIGVENRMLLVRVGNGLRPGTTSRCGDGLTTCLNRRVQDLVQECLRS